VKSQRGTFNFEKKVRLNGEERAMKRYIFISVLVVLFIISGCTSKHSVDERLPFVITDSSGQNKICFDELIKRLQSSDMVSVGEIHTDSLTHVLEYEILKALYSKNQSTAIALEMFERDVQNALNDYLAGKIDEDTFLKHSRPWGNYKTAYKPLIEFAKTNGLPVIAMNVPRRYAAIVARKGGKGLETVSDSEKVWIAKTLKALDDDYRKRFISLMTGGDKPMPMAHMNPQKMYEAQCIKDDTMAESIDNFLKKNPGMKIITYEGDFHSDYRLGIVKKVLLLRPELKVSVVSVVPVENLDSINYDENKGRGDFIIFVKSGKEKSL